MSAGLIAARRRGVPVALTSRRLEGAAAVALTSAIAVVSSLHLLRRDVVEGDALVHQYWMRSFTDPALFSDSLTASLRGSERYPDGYQGLFWVASHVADPIAFGEWLGIALMAAAGMLVFAIVREHARLAAGGVARRRALPRAAGASLLRRLPTRVPARDRAAHRAARAPAP